MAIDYMQRGSQFWCVFKGPHQTSNLRDGSSNLSERTSKINGLSS